MRTRIWTNLACCLCLTPCVPVTAADAPPAPLASETTIVVHLANGSSFTAALDARTDAGQLWLRFGKAGAELFRPIDWDGVVSAEVAGQRLSGSDLRSLVAQIRREIPAQPVAPAMPSRIEIIGTPDAGPRRAKPVAPQADARRVASLCIDANVGRWDENVDPDGLVVHVYPLDADGAIVPVHGTLNVDLKLAQRGINSLNEPFVDAGNWQEAVHTEDFGRGGAIYRLRFQRVDPEFDRSVRNPGLVHARLVVPGQGTFEASTHLSSIRPFNPARDRLQALTGHGDFPGYRYFANERTDDGRR
jgi:hypothetical protein